MAYICTTSLTNTVSYRAFENEAEKKNLLAAVRKCKLLTWRDMFHFGDFRCGAIVGLSENLGSPSIVILLREIGVKSYIAT